jgi:hypothetical protein
MGEACSTEVVYRVLIGQLEGKSHLEDRGVDGIIILK